MVILAGMWSGLSIAAGVLVVALGGPPLLGVGAWLAMMAFFMWRVTRPGRPE